MTLAQKYVFLRGFNTFNQTLLIAKIAPGTGNPKISHTSKLTEEECTKILRDLDFTRQKC